MKQSHITKYGEMIVKVRNRSQEGRNKERDQEETKPSIEALALTSQVYSQTWIVWNATSIVIPWLQKKSLDPTFMCQITFFIMRFFMNEG